MNKYSHSFGKRWTHGQLSFLSALIAQSLFFAIAQVSSGELPPNADVTTVAGLVAGYNFDEGSGTTVADVSGFGNTGTINGASWTSQGKFGNALNFDGISNWVTVNDSDSLDLTSGMTLEAWVYPTDAPNNWTTVITKERPGNLVYGLFARSPSSASPNNGPLVNVVTASLSDLYGPSPVPLNFWTHLAGTYDVVNGQSLYVDGVEVAHISASGSIITSIGPLRMGGNLPFSEYFIGRIDEVRIYNRALSQTEIQTDMNTPVGTAGPCVLSPGYWMNHPAAWCMQSIQIGCMTYSRAQAIAIMRSNSSQDKTYSLAQQLIAAKLNIACGNTNSSCIAAAITAADSWLCTHAVGSGVRANSSAWQQIKATYGLLVSYNAGQLCAPICVSPL